jgi:hypothetical protein
LGIESKLPDYINKELWNDFLAMRKKIKKPATERAIKSLLKKLALYKDSGADVNKILDKSIISCWPDVYDKDDNRNSGGTYHGTNAAYKPQPQGTSEPVQALDGDAEAPAGSD